MTPARSTIRRHADKAGSEPPIRSLLRPSDRHWQVLTNKMARATREQRRQLFELYADEIVVFVKTTGLA